jgi:hypothetical protein
VVRVSVCRSDALQTGSCRFEESGAVERNGDHGEALVLGQVGWLSGCSNVILLSCHPCRTRLIPRAILGST